MPLLLRKKNPPRPHVFTIQQLQRFNVTEETLLQDKLRERIGCRWPLLTMWGPIFCHVFNIKLATRICLYIHPEFCNKIKSNGLPKVGFMINQIP